MRTPIPLILLLAASAAGQTPSNLQQLEAAIRAVLDEHGCGPAGVALVSREDVLWTAGIGSGAGEANAATLFRQGSISKSIVGLAVLVLQERGMLNLDDQLASLAPELAFENRWEPPDPVRLAHLLEHTAGFDDLRLKDYAHNDPDPIPLREALAFCRGSLVSRWPPGRFFSYSNAGPAAAAYVVEKVSGRSFERFVEEEFFGPLGMSTASFLLTPETEAALAVGLNRLGQPAPYAQILTRPSGALNASPRDMAQFVRFLLNRGEWEGERLLAPKSIERMETARTTVAAREGLDGGYGLGNGLFPGQGFPFRGHNGAITGFVSEYGYLPDEGLGYAVMLACENPPARRDVLELVQGFLVRGIEPPAPPASGTPGIDVSEWAGYYRPFTPRAESQRFIERLAGIMRLAPGENGGIVLDPAFGRPQAFVPLGGAAFRAKDEPFRQLVLARDEERRLIAGSPGNLRQAAPLVVWTELTLGIASFTAMAAALVLAVGAFFRRRPGGHGGLLQIAAAAPLFLLAAIVLLSQGAINATDRLAHPTIWSVGFVAATYAFAVSGPAAFLRIVLHPPQRRGRDYWLSLAASAGAVLVAAYLAWWGVIGRRTWS